MSGAPAACSRRALLRGASTGAVALGCAVLVSGCGDGAPAVGAPDAAFSGQVPVADVPVGAAVVVQVQGGPVVLAQPVAGDYRAWSAACTHAGGIVAPEEGLVVACPLHGSRFDTADGAAPVNGPATEPLPPVPLAVEGAELVLG